MGAATLIDAASAASPRLLVDVNEVRGRESPLDQLAAALGRDFADRLVAALSREALGRLESALSHEFSDRIATLAREHGAAG